MTRYEWFRWFTFPIMPTHLNLVRNDIKNLLHKNKNLINPTILDVGGRKSPYTIGLSAKITLLDVPQESYIQEELHLGFTSDIMDSIKKQRSNIDQVIVQDMTRSSLLESSYNAVVSIEVIEHVEADKQFVENIYKVIKPGGWAYFTTPNGDYIKNDGPDKNPDHIRHYTKKQLQSLLEEYFDFVDVHYAVSTGHYRVMGLKRMDIKYPLSMIRSAFGNIINRLQSLNISDRPIRTAHLVAIAYKN